MFGKTGRAATTYIVLAALNRAVAMLILPFVSHAITPAELGAATTVGATSLFVVALLATPLDSLVVYAAPRDGEEPQALLRFVGLYCQFFIPALMIIVAAIFAVFVPELLGISGKIWAIELVSIGMVPAMSVFALPYVKVTQNLRKFVALALTSVLVLAISKLVLVVGLHLGVLGWVISDLISTTSAAMMALLLVHLPRARISTVHLKKAAGFALPIIPHTLSLWAITSLSRPALALVSNLQQVGYLAIGMTVSSGSMIFVGELNRSVQPRFSQETFPAPTAKTFTPVRLLMIAATAVPAAAGCVMVLLGPWIFAEPFWPAFKLSGILLAGQAIYGFYAISLNYLVLTAGITKFNAVATGSGALVVITVAFLLGARYGALGVAYGMAAGYLTMAVVAVFLTKVAGLDIRPSAWRSCWPEIILPAAALAVVVLALAEPAKSDAGRAMALASICLLAVTAVLFVRRDRSPAQVA